MGLWDKLKNELIDIVQWMDGAPTDLAHRFERYQNEIKNGAKLIVREGTVAVFVREGKVADIFQPGTYTLATENLPVLSTLAGWKYGFNSPFVAEVIFVRTTMFLDQKWGTKNPFMCRCPEFGPVRLRAFGSYAFRVTDPGAFVGGVLGNLPNMESATIAEQLRNLIVARFTDRIGEAQVPVLDLASRQDEIAKDLLGRMAPDLQTYGIGLSAFYIENITLPPEVEKVLDQRSSMGIVGDLGRYTQFQTAQAIPAAAANPGGAAGAAMGLGAGFMMGQQMMGAMATPAAPGALPPPLPSAPAFHVNIKGQASGPHAFGALQQLVAAGELTPATLVWKAGTPAWIAASQAPELAGLFQPPAMPPPLP